MLRDQTISHQISGASFQQDLLDSSLDNIAKLKPIAQAKGIDITLLADESIVISRWNFSRTFMDSSPALKFLRDMGVK